MAGRGKFMVEEAIGMILDDWGDNYDDHGNKMSSDDEVDNLFSASSGDSFKIERPEHYPDSEILRQVGMIEEAIQVLLFIHYRLKTGSYY